MRARAPDRRLCLELARDAQDVLAPARIAPARVEIGEQRPGPLDAVNLDEQEPGLPHLVPEILGPVEEARREVILALGPVPVLPLLEIARDDPGEARIAEEIPREPVERRSVPGDRGRHENAAGTEDAPGLAERLNAVPAVG